MRRIAGTRGFTLSEMMVTVMIVGILAALALPSYRKSVEASYWRSAQDILLTIYTGETVYSAVNPGDPFVFPLPDTDPPNDWLRISMDDPNIGTSVPVDFDVVDGGVDGFIATAKRRTDGRCMWIDATVKVVRFTAQPASTLGCTADWDWASIQ